ncbi:MAG: hypothetical protein M3Y28_07840 [Armatimonadota bacterium]|nr:hypothetical protein [Armatimonadota bacterium]
MFWTKAHPVTASAPAAPPPAITLPAEARLEPALRRLEQLRAQMLAEIAVYTKQFYGEKARQTVVAAPHHTRMLGQRLADLKAEVRALEAGTAQCVVERLGHPILWSRSDLSDPHWWWRDDFDCDYQTSDADRALRDRLYSVFGRLQPILQEYGYRPDWRGVHIANRRALFGRASFQKAFGEYRALLADSRCLQQTVDAMRRERATQEAERLWHDA